MHTHALTYTHMHAHTHTRMHTYSHMLQTEPMACDNHTYIVGCLFFFITSFFQRFPTKICWCCALRSLNWSILTLDLCEASPIRFAWLTNHHLKAAISPFGSVMTVHLTLLSGGLLIVLIFTVYLYMQPFHTFALRSMCLYICIYVLHLDTECHINIDIIFFISIFKSLLRNSVRLDSRLCNNFDW